VPTSAGDARLGVRVGRWRVVLSVSAVLLSAVSGGVGRLVGDVLWTWAAVAVLAAQAGVEVWLAVGHVRRRRAARLTGVPLPDGLVARPEQVDQVVALLTSADRRPVGITATTGLTGAGGFGKTTLAVMVRADPRIRKRFRSHYR
jgi:hypothetical protein